MQVKTLGEAAPFSLEAAQCLDLFDHGAAWSHLTYARDSPHDSPRHAGRACPRATCAGPPAAGGRGWLGESPRGPARRRWHSAPARREADTPRPAPQRARPPMRLARRLTAARRASVGQRRCHKVSGLRQDCGAGIGRQF